jgi:CBS domain-containing protein
MWMPDTTESAHPDDPVRRIMAPRLAAVDTGESLLSVAQELTAGDIGAVVVSSPGTPAGVLSERDIVTVVATGGDVGTMQAGEVMTGDLVVAELEDSIESVGRLMLRAGVRHVPIRHGGDLVGLVSIRDVLAVLLPEQRPAR